MSSALYHLEHRFCISPDTLAELRSECSTGGNSFTYVGRTRLRICIFKGVPAKHVDVLLLDGPYLGHSGATQPHSRNYLGSDPPRPYCTVLDIGRKEGRYDGAIRWRLTVRDFLPASPTGIDRPPHGRLSFELETGSVGGADWLSVVALWEDGGVWASSFPVLRYQIDKSTDLANVFMWQANTWFAFLYADTGPGKAEVEKYAALWAKFDNVLAITDLNDLNRLAQRDLYNLATGYGFVKLTKYQREKLMLGPDSQQWQTTERVEALRLKLLADGNPTGVGQYTLEAARGHRLSLPVGTCQQCYELLDECLCQD